MSTVEIQQGVSPLVLAFPHSSTEMPDEFAAHLNDEGRILRDTDWHVERLYADLVPEATTVAARFHRYVVDANRPPDGKSLYPGQATTDLVPLSDFDGNEIWDIRPNADDIDRRRHIFHASYHAGLEAEMERVKSLHGFVILYDCHSIRSRVPRLFDGVLPDMNIGTNSGTTCAPQIETIIADACSRSEFSSVLNGRFKGGWTTRHYGRPANGWHAVQMELAQSTHLATEEPPFAYSAERAAKLRPVLGDILAKLTEWRPT
ncbi:MAG: N-formylglutamate deformylase [Pseudomonadota bacterium]